MTTSQKAQHCNECGEPGARRQYEHRDKNRDWWLCPRCEDRAERAERNARRRKVGAP